MPPPPLMARPILETGISERHRRACLALEVVALSAACLGYLSFFTQGLPFYFEDLEWIGDGTTISTLLSRTLDLRQHGTFERPFELLCLQSLEELGVAQAGGFRAFKLAAFAGFVSLLHVLLRRLGVGRYWSLAGCGFFALTLPVLESVGWICDFEIVAQLFTLAALFVFEDDLARAERGRGGRLMAQLAIVALALLGSATKASAWVIPIVLGLRVLGSPLLAVRRYAGLFGALAAAAAAPHMGAARSPGIGWSPSLLGELAGKFATVVGWPVLLLGLGAAVAAYLPRATDKGESPVVTRPALGIAWLLSNVTLLGFLPGSDSRYLVGTLASFALLAVVSLQGLASRLGASWRVPAMSLLGLLAAGQASYNVYLAVQYRGFWGSQFVAAAKVVDFIEDHHEDAVVVYPYWRELLYAAAPRNRYVLLREKELADAGITATRDGSGTSLEFGDRPTAVLLASMAPDPSLKLVVVLTGSSDSLFDRWASWIGLRPRAMLESPYVEQAVAYPTLYYVYRIS
jgi:hypothetical protein